MTVKEYTLHGCPMSIKIAVTADLHEGCPDKLLNALYRVRPELILAVGDFFELLDPEASPEELSTLEMWVQTVADRLGWVGHRKNAYPENSLRFFSNATQIAPVIYARGNHEQFFPEELRSFFREKKIPVLENQDMEWNGIRIGGTVREVDGVWLSTFAAKSGYKILLNHKPEQFSAPTKLASGGYLPPLSEYPFSLVVSGHAHGGQMRLPFPAYGKKNQRGDCGIGVFAPGQGFFPRYTRGVYQNRLAVSAGCANTVGLPRFGNPTQLMVLKLQP